MRTNRSTVEAHVSAISIQFMSALKDHSQNRCEVMTEEANVGRSFIHATVRTRFRFRDDKQIVHGGILELSEDLPQEQFLNAQEVAASIIEQLNGPDAVIPEGGMYCNLNYSTTALIEKTITINSETFTVTDNNITYRGVCQEAQKKGNPTVVWHDAKTDRSGTLIEGESIRIVDGMRFTCLHTDNA